jgi:hypothetical protein
MDGRRVADIEGPATGCSTLSVKRRPDIIHLNGTFTHGALRWHAPTLVTGHSCVLSWWRAVKGEDAPAPAWNCYKAKRGAWPARRRTGGRAHAGHA